MTPDTPDGRKPVIRLIAALLAAFSAAAYLCLMAVGLVAPEPAGWRPVRIAIAVVFVVSFPWAMWLYREWLREQRKGH